MCNNCNRTFAAQKGLDVHVCRVRICGVCGFRSRTAYHLRRHNCAKEKRELKLKLSEFFFKIN